ncbi:MAG: D-alanyl-D-alanine carboxypeptidase/D-alanyl-D-alanine-endopeptidase [Acidobacteria bacterium]|nr:MAG: D-alanyl-D-alanine carboxypeptidase/D-alanyl-D-alanine-endopeptidase [Acidobacteriota bacterium]
MPSRTVRLTRIALIALLLPAVAAAAGVPPKTDPPLTPVEKVLQRRLGQILRGPGFQHGFWGVYVYDASRRRVLFDHNGERWFTPASNAKLFTLATALSLLGSNFRFHTVVQSTAAPDAQGVIAGNVVLVGAGDPSLSGRSYPYEVPPPEPALPYDPSAIPLLLARSLAGRGVTQIKGNIVGDDSYFTDDPYPVGWAIDDMLWDYGAPVSALTLNDNTRFLQIYPGPRPGALPRLVWTPALNPPATENLIRTGAAGSATRVDLNLDPATGALRLTGMMALDNPGVLEALAVRHPALYAGQLLKQALEAQGIKVEGKVIACHSNCLSGPPYQLTAWQSPPLAEIEQVTAKVSQNLEAELLLRVLGKLLGNSASPAHDPSPDAETRAGEAVVHGFLYQAGLNATDTALIDGSGLARSDLVTPAGIVRLLLYMDRGQEAKAWHALLPVAGEDGTLQHRFLHEAATGRLDAKTGSLSHVNSLSGYVQAREGDTLVFSILSNNVNRPNAAVRKQIDQIANLLAAW